MAKARDVTADRQIVSQVVVARQPIIDRHGRVVGFELLYRPRQGHAPAETGEQMTAEVVLGALTIGLDQLVGDKVMFCNAERGALTGATPVTLPPARTVIEVLETVDLDDEAVQGCRELVEAGFRLALDDFVWVAGSERVLELASIVKVDFLTTSRPDVLALVERCRPFDVLMLAEKVETDEDVAWAMAHGFDLFQGYAIERPALVTGQTVATSALAYVQLAVTLLAEELDLEEIEEVLRREPALVVQVLQMASIGNRHGLRRQVRSVHEALVLMGTRKIRQWIALTILSGQPSPSPDGLGTALVRARMAEVLARGRGWENPEFAFTSALLSALDLMLGVPLAELAESMDLDESLKTAAFRQEGTAGELVAEVTRYQETLDGSVGSSRPAGDLDDAAAEAFAWAMPYVNGLVASGG